MSVLDVRTAARRAIHDKFAVAADYTDASNPVPEPITVRWYGQNVHPIGDLEAIGYAEVWTRIDRLKFMRGELAAARSGAGLTLSRSGLVTITDFGSAAFRLDAMLPPDGPEEIIWTVIPEGPIAP